MRSKISVQDGEMAIAQRGVKTSCAIAAAIMSQVPAARFIKVDQDSISWLDVNRQERLVFRTPEPAKAFIESWDRGEQCEPFTFTLTDTALIERRPPRARTAKTRVSQAGKARKPTRNPGIRRDRPARAPECSTEG